MSVQLSPLSELEHQKEPFKNQVIIFTHYFTNTFLLTNSHWNKKCCCLKKKKKTLLSCAGKKGFRFPAPILGLQSDAQWGLGLIHKTQQVLFRQSLMGSQTAEREEETSVLPVGPLLVDQPTGRLQILHIHQSA